MVADNMSHNRFQNLLASLHFNDNDQSNRQEEVECWKIRPWLEMFHKQCPEEHNSIEEQMVTFRGTQPNKEICHGQAPLHFLWNPL